MKLKIIVLFITFFITTTLIFSSDFGNKSNYFEPYVEYDVYLYPNPVTEGTFKVVGDDIHKIEITNIIGQKLDNWDSSKLNSKVVLIKLNEFEKGMYLIKITVKDDIQVIKKFLVR